MDSLIGKSTWRERAGTLFSCEKQPAHGRSGMVVSNHPLASAAGLEMLAAGGNAIDAAVATQFALTVVEPMMVGLIGGTTMHVRLADGRHTIIDGMSAVPRAGHPTMYRPVPQAPPEVYDVEGRENLVGPKSVATPGSLRAWCLALRQHGTMSLADVMQPAIRHASRGFAVTPYLADCIVGASPDLLQDPFIADRLLPDGRALEAGERLVQGDYAEALTLISQHGEKALHGGPLGDLVVECMERSGGFVGLDDLTGYRVVERAPIRGQYRGWEIERADTTHLTVADGSGNVVSTTQTINSLFGACFIIPGTGMVPNNYMSNFDPRPGNALSIAPGKRVTTSMSPMMALREGRVVFALGLPGGRKIFPAALQALLNLIDHGMTLQEAVEAPRVWTEGPVLEVEHGFPASVREGLTALGHTLQIMPT